MTQEEKPTREENYATLERKVEKLQEECRDLRYCRNLMNRGLVLYSIVGGVVATSRLGDYAENGYPDSLYEISLGIMGVLVFSSLFYTPFNRNGPCGFIAREDKVEGCDDE